MSTVPLTGEHSPAGVKEKRSNIAHSLPPAAGCCHHFRRQTNRLLGTITSAANVEQMGWWCLFPDVHLDAEKMAAGSLP
jgi:hypothetical protein